MSGAYDCNYDFVDDPLSALVEAHAEIRRLEDEHAAEIARLRLTDAEWEAIDTAEASLLRESTDLHTPLPVRQRLGSAAATLRGLLERMEHRQT